MGAPIVGSSAVIAPDGRILSEPKTANEQLILADLDLTLVTKAKTFADASGHCTCYSCPGAKEMANDLCRQQARYALARS